MQERVGFMTRVKRFLNTPRAENLILLIYTAFSFLLVLVHEPWRDEAQFWLLARDASLPEILGNISKEGIPPLWQLILKPFVLLGLPYYPTMDLISFVLVAAAAWIFVKKAPFRRFVKYILLFSPVFIYCYSTISRSYALMPITIVLLAVAYPNRLQKPLLYGLLLALLFEAHMILWGIVAALSVEFLISTIQAYKIEKSIRHAAKSLNAAIPMLIVGLQYLLYFYAGVRASNALSGFTVDLNALSIITNFFRGIGSVFGNTLAVRENFGMYLAWLFFALSTISIVRDKRWKKFALIAGVSILFEGVISGFIYSDGNYRSMSVFLILIYMIWLATKDGRSMEITFFNLRTTWIAVICAYTVFGMLCVAPQVIEDIRYTFSDSNYTAAYIEQNIPADSLILTSSNAEISAISAYLDDYRFYDSEKEKYFSYYVWDTNPGLVSSNGLENCEAEEVSPENRLRRVAQEAIALTNGEEDGFYYVSVLDDLTIDAVGMYREHIIYETPEYRLSRDNYQILYVAFDEAKQWVNDTGNPG